MIFNFSQGHCTANSAIHLPPCFPFYCEERFPNKLHRFSMLTSAFTPPSSILHDHGERSTFDKRITRLGSVSAGRPHPWCSSVRPKSYSTDVQKTITTALCLERPQIWAPVTPTSMGSSNGEGGYNIHPNISHSIEPKIYE